MLVLLLIGQIEGIKSLASGFAEFFYAVVRMLKLCVGIESAFVSRDGEQVVQADGDAAGTQSPEAGENQDDAGFHFSPIYVHPLQILKEMFPGGVPIIVERRTRAGMAGKKGVGSAGSAHVIRVLQLLHGGNAGVDDLVMSGGRVLRRCVEVGGAVVPTGGVKDDDVAVLDKVLKVPQVPIRRKVRAPVRASSSMAMAVLGQPMPVLVQEIGMPL